MKGVTKELLKPDFTALRILIAVFLAGVAAVFWLESREKAIAQELKTYTDSETKRAVDKIDSIAGDVRYIRDRVDRMADRVK